MKKEKIVLIVAISLLVFSVWQLKKAVYDPVQVPEIPPVNEYPPSDMELGSSDLFEEGELAKLLGVAESGVRNPWVRYEGLIRPNASLIPVPPPPPNPPGFILPPLSNAVYTQKRRPKRIRHLTDIKVIDRPEKEGEEQDDEM